MPNETQGNTLYDDFNMEAEVAVMEAIGKKLRRTSQPSFDIKGPYAGTKKALNRKMWEADRKKRKMARKTRKRNRR
jgi:hypothetical protein